MRVLMPESVSEALAFKATNPDIVPIAGGTDLLVQWPGQLERQAASYLDLSGLDELRTIRWTQDTLELGALTTYWDTLCQPRVGVEHPLLHDAARQVGAIQIQTRGTWAGNIINASPAADGVPVLMAYDATVVLASVDGERQVPLSAFYHGYKQIEARPHELIRKILVPRREHDVQFFEKVAPRQAQAITVVGVTVAHSSCGWRVVASSMAPTVCRCPHLESLLQEGTPVSCPEDLLEPLRADVSPIDDLRSSAHYREQVMSRVLYFNLGETCPAFRSTR